MAMGPIFDVISILDFVRVSYCVDGQMSIAACGDVCSIRFIAHEVPHKRNEISNPIYKHSECL